jgi:hypothetical protein
MNVKYDSLFLLAAIALTIGAIYFFSKQDATNGVNPRKPNPLLPSPIKPKPCPCPK